MNWLGISGQTLWKNHKCQARKFELEWGLANGLLSKGIDEVYVALS